MFALSLDPAMTPASVLSSSTGPALVAPPSSTGSAVVSLSSTGAAGSGSADHVFVVPLSAPRTWSARVGPAVAAVQGRIWVAAGAATDVTFNDVSAQTQLSPVRERSESDALLLIALASRSALCVCAFALQVHSFNGVAWTSHGNAPFSVRWSAGLLATNSSADSALLVGGRTRIGVPFPADVWLGSGLTPLQWVSSGSGLPVTRADFGLVEWKGFRWLIAGADYFGIHNDVWTQSAVGTGGAWSQRANAQFSPRQSFGCVVYRDAIYVLGQTAQHSTAQRGDSVRRERQPAQRRHTAASAATCSESTRVLPLSHHLLLSLPLLLSLCRAGGWDLNTGLNDGE